MQRMRRKTERSLLFVYCLFNNIPDSTFDTSETTEKRLQ